MSRPCLHKWDSLPLLYASQAWLSRVTGIKLAAIAKHMRRTSAVSLLSPFAQRRFGDYASTMRLWVEAWGLDRVLAWLDEHDPNAAQVLREGADRLDCEEEDRAHSYRVHQARKHERRRSTKNIRKTYTARLESILVHQPLGLVPAATIAAIAGVSYSVIDLYMQRNGIAPFSDRQVGFPHGDGSWDKLVEAWGLERTRAWVVEWRPKLMQWFERNACAGMKRRALLAGPAGCLPSGVLAAAYDVSLQFVRDTLREAGIAKYHSGGYGPFPTGQGSFALLIARFGHDRARLWLAGHAPQYVEHFDADVAGNNRKAANTAPAPVATSTPSTRSATGAISKPKLGAALRKKMAGQIAAHEAKVKAASRDGLAQEAKDRRRPPPPETPVARPAGHVETIEEWLARGGRVTRLVGAGNPNVGMVQG